MTLTKREQEFLADYCQGLSLKESAAKRGVTTGAVSYHRNSIFEITQRRSPCALMLWGIERGFVTFTKQCLGFSCGGKKFDTKDPRQVFCCPDCKRDAQKMFKDISQHYKK